ncbi:peptidoglycan-binding protein [Pleurocapsales cyanobacterium LEGE 10410]|nr:peptidoglycan-binding protein [Pleurocapsales cyanobacterium LEGE 10410]
MTLRKGDKGQEVMLLQAALQDGGFRLPQYGVDGIFGNETESAVKQAQDLFLMEPTGIADQKLFNVLGIENITSPTFRNNKISKPSMKQWVMAGILVGALAFAAQKMRG